MSRHEILPHTWRNLVLASAIGYSPSRAEPVPLLWSCHGIDREPTDRECPECAEEARRELTCRHCGEATEPEEERCCGRSVCMAAERSERRSER